MIAVEFQGVSKQFGDLVAVDNVDLCIENGEFFTLLGPSGSGKTTCLRLVAGFNLPSSGRILLDGADVSTKPPYERNVNTVFQDYALFPHLSVGENVAYGPMVRGIGRTERRRMADEMLALVELSGHSARRPSELSGGQRQRVALARALVNRPKVLLLDEPLGALDLKLRHQMQIELKAIQQRVGITFIFVTHDQEEALTMSDRLAVFERGRIAQIGTPAEVYESPATEFIAGFVGTANVLSGETSRRILGHDGLYALRPEKISISLAGEPGDPGARWVEGTVREVMFAGMMTRYTVALEDNAELHVVAQNLAPETSGTIARGTRVVLAWNPVHERPLAAS
ncbi:MAG: ABC transporter ATP-binding protein [Thermoanaerobaculia bacterium]